MSKKQWIKENLKDGEQYAGLILGKDGQPDYHLILLADQINDVTWNDAKKWAGKIEGALPNRREQSLLFANLKESFDSRWHWSDAQDAGHKSYAWMQDFSDGFQGTDLKDGKYRARAVRRIYIKEAV